LIAQLVEPETAAKKCDAEDSDEEYEGASGHLIYGNWGVEKTDIHQLRRAEDDEHRTPERLNYDRLTVVPVRSHAAGIQRRRIFQPVRC
jgi:hypothetical protein